VSPAGSPVFYTSREGDQVFRLADGGSKAMFALGVTAIAADDTEIVFAQESADRLRARSHDWAAAARDLARLDARIAPASRITAIALDQGSVYFSVKSRPCARDGAIYRLPRAGGAVTALVTDTVTSDAIALDQDALYFAAGTALMKLPLSGGAPSALVEGLVGCENGVAVDSAFVYFSCAESVDGTMFTAVWRAPK
jgi:sugar lactone lactonase YvrE